LRSRIYLRQAISGVNVISYLKQNIYYDKGNDGSGDVQPQFTRDSSSIIDPAEAGKTQTGNLDTHDSRPKRAGKSGVAPDPGDERAHRTPPTINAPKENELKVREYLDAVMDVEKNINGNSAEPSEASATAVIHPTPPPTYDRVPIDPANSKLSGYRDFPVEGEDTIYDIAKPQPQVNTAKPQHDKAQADGSIIYENDDMDIETGDEMGSPARAQYTTPPAPLTGVSHTTVDSALNTRASSQSSGPAPRSENIYTPLHAPREMGDSDSASISTDTLEGRTSEDSDELDQILRDLSSDSNSGMPSSIYTPAPVGLSNGSTASATTQYSNMPPKLLSTFGALNTKGQNSATPSSITSDNYDSLTLTPTPEELKRMQDKKTEETIEYLERQARERDSSTGSIHGSVAGQGGGGMQPGHGYQASSDGADGSLVAGFISTYSSYHVGASSNTANGMYQDTGFGDDVTPHTLLTRDNLINLSTADLINSLIQRGANIQHVKGNENSIETNLSYDNEVKSLNIEGDKNKVKITSSYFANQADSLIIKGNKNKVISSLGYGTIKIEGDNNKVYVKEGTNVMQTGNKNKIIFGEPPKSVAEKLSSFKSSVGKAVGKFFSKNKHRQSVKPNDSLYAYKTQTWTVGTSHADSVRSSRAATQSGMGSGADNKGGYGRY